MEMKRQKKYLAVKEAIQQDIAALKPGDLAGTEMAYVKKFNVSRPTVRHAINDLIEEGAVMRVAGVGLQIPSRQQALDPQKKLLIMVNALESDDGMFTRVVLGAVDVSNKKGYNYQIMNNLFEETKYNFLLNNDMSQYLGVITTAYDTYYDKKSMQFLKENNIPVVLIDNPFRRGIFSYVVADDYAGGYLVGTHLAQLGHKRVLFIMNGWPAQTTHNRMQGLREGLAEYDVELRDEDVVKVPFEADADGYILENARNPSFDYSAIACSNDMLAMYVVNALDKLELRVPDDISITGFGDYRIASMMRHPLTTIHVSGYKMGSEAARLIYSSDFARQTKKIILNVHLVERSTTAPVSEPVKKAILI